MDETNLWKRKHLLYMSWEKLGRYLDDLHNQVIESGYEPTCIIGIHRGGLVPATFFSNRLNLPNYKLLRILRNLSNTRYSQRATPKFGWIAPDSLIKGELVLLVDDIAGDGGTLVLALEKLYQLEPAAIKTAVLVKNVHAQTEPDYSAVCVDDWVVFPWENRQIEKGQVREYL